METFRLIWNKKYSEEITFHKVAKAWQVQMRVLYALMLWDARTRFGRHSLGFLWLFLEPVFFVALFIAFKVFIRTTDSAGMHDAYFIVTGLVPFLLFRQLMQTLTNSLTRSKALLAFPQVTVFDVLLATIILEFVSILFVFGGMVLVISLIDVPPNVDNPLLVLYGVLLMGVSGSGLGLIFGSLSPIFPSLRTITNPLFGRPLFFTSGIFFTAEMLPAEFRSYALLNPLLHITEITRSAFFIQFESRYIDWTYATMFAFSSLLFGLLFNQALRNEVVKQT